MTATETRCGFVALIGAPNAGKSTLLNQLVGLKVSIVSRKVQTTRTVVRGIGMHGSSQVIFVDTPGIFQPSAGSTARWWPPPGVGQGCRYRRFPHRRKAWTGAGGAGHPGCAEGCAKAEAADPQQDRSRPARSVAGADGKAERSGDLR